MYPILFDSNATSFTTNGIGRLSDAASCKVIEERNGSYELEMEYPMSGLHFSDLKNGNIIYAKPFQAGKLQAFRIYKITKKARDLAEINARHISYQLSFIPIAPSGEIDSDSDSDSDDAVPTPEFTADTAATALSKLKEHAAENCPFIFSSDVTRAGTFKVDKPDSFRALLGGQEGSVLDIFHGEYEWDNYNVILHEERGSNKGVTITYGKNLIDLSQEENIENTVTGIYPYWQNMGNDPAAILGLMVVNGYFYEEEFYEDAEHTKKIDPTKEKNYKDTTTSKLYFWTGKKYEEDEIGQYGEGNIDLYDRPVYLVASSSSSSTTSTETYETLDAFSYREGGQYVLIPRIGKDDSGAAVKWTDEQATTNYTSTGKYLGKFNTSSLANAYNNKLRKHQKRLYGKIGETSKYVELPEKILYSDNAANFPFKRSVVKDFTSQFDVSPSEAQLREYTQQYISNNKLGIPAVSLDVNFINLFETKAYADVAALQTVNLCDTVTVEFPKLSVSTTSKVVKTDYDVLRERYNEVTIGESSASLSSTISDQLEQVTYRPTTSQMSKAIDRATGVLNSATRGHVIINRNDSGWANELLFLDNENIQQAQNVIRINMNGIGFSSTGYKGPYYQSWTNDGHLTLGGINDSYGTLEILDENAKPTLFVDKDGLKLLALDYVGYYVDGKFYEDENLTTELAKKKNKGYYDRITSQLYKWDGDNNGFVLDSEAGVIARMTHDGLDIKQGTIDLLMDEDVGFHADGNVIRLGSFYVEKDRRDLLMSADKTVGMGGSVKPNDGRWYLWAGWERNPYGEDFYRFCVNSGGAYVMTTDNERRFDIAETLRSFEHRLDELEEHDSGSDSGSVGGYEDIPPGSQH